MSKQTVADDLRFDHYQLGPFLAAYARTGNVTIAAQITGEQIGIPYTRVKKTHYEYMRGARSRSEEYRRAFEAAHEEAIDYLEAEARRRAVEGTDRPVFYQGRQVGTVTEYSDHLLMFLLRGALPDKYAERTKTEHSGNLGLQHGPFAGMTLDEIAEGAELDDTPEDGGVDGEG